MTGETLLGRPVAAPTPSDGRELDAVTVSPGLPGFIAMFVIALAVVLLLVDMARRVRRVRATARVEERMGAEREQQGRDETDGDETGRDETGGGVTGGDDAASPGSDPGDTGRDEDSPGPDPGPDERR